MSFDIFFQPCRFAAQAVEAENPFTGKVETTQPNAPLTKSELAAVRHALDVEHVTKRSDHGGYDIQLPDGGLADVFAEDLETGCMFAVRVLSPGLVALLFDVLDAANWVMLPAMENSIAITCSPGSVSNMPDGFPAVVICNSSAELELLLIGGFEAWKQY